MNLSNQMKEPQTLNRKLHQEIRMQSVFGLAIYTIQNCVHSSTNFFFSKIRDIHQVCRKKAKSLLPIKHSSNIVSETILIENSEDDLFFIYWLLTSSVITITCHTLSIEIDNGASISLLDW